MEEVKREAKKRESFPEGKKDTGNRTFQLWGLINVWKENTVLKQRGVDEEEERLGSNKLPGDTGVR